MKDILAVLGALFLAAPIAAQFLFGDDGKPSAPRGGRGPVTYPADELQLERARK